MKRIHQVFALLALSSACDDSFSRGWLVDRTRVLGARVEATAEPSRSSIAPGEHVRLTWLVGAPSGPPALGWAFATCASPPGFVPVPRCAGGALTTGAGGGDDELVVMELDAPSQEKLGDASEILVLAAFCEHGEPALDPMRFEASCSAGGEAILASLNLRTTSAGPNRNPEIADDAVTFDGVAMAPRAAGMTCSSAEAPVAAAGTEHAFGFVFRGDEREPPANEALVLSHVATSGELDRQYSSLDVGEATPKVVTIPWTSPPRDQVSDEGRLVEIFFVLRDGRGGTAFARRAVCVRR